LHLHSAYAEGFYLMAGELTLYVPGDAVRLAPGGFFLVPPGVPHAYGVGDSPARWL
jgi:quercetin dioxygenase-like cupin family protein